jgi:hypothetical protein
METEDQSCARFEAELASIAALDQRYYLNASPSIAERRDYAARKNRLNTMRSQFYAEFARVRQSGALESRRCRYFFRPSRS